MWKVERPSKLWYEDITTSQWISRSISQSRMEFMLLPACYISSAANTTNFKINHCRKFLTHLCITKTKQMFA
jgi:hypothetical protein